MDLQAILDATDSSSDEGEEDAYPLPSSAMGFNIIPASPRRPPQTMPMMTPPRSTGITAMSPLSTTAATPSKVDLEQILREDDDDDDDEEDDYLSGSFYNASSIKGSTSATPTTMSAYSSSNYNYTSTASNPEDWDVLQAILGEDDEDDDDAGTDVVTALSDYYPSVASATSSMHHHHTSKHINMILQQDEEDEDALVLDPAASTKNNRALQELEQRESYGVDSFITAAQSQDTLFSEPSTSSSPNKQRQPPPQFQEQENNALFTEASLKYAQNYEKKLFRAGHRDIVSPLQVKRRLKPKIELNTKMQQQRKRQQLAPKEVAAKATKMKQPRFNFSGTVENKAMRVLSQTLSDFSTSVAKRTKYKQLALPTALAVNARFIAIGLQTGIILAFDLFESLRQKLGLHQTEQFHAKQAGSVTSIDLSLDQGEYLVAGYTSGYVVLWDTIKGVALKSIIETANPSPMTSVRFLTNLKIVTVDAGGLVNKVSFAKTLLWNSYSVETECLLDGTAGQILAMNVMEPFSMAKSRLSSTKQQQQQQKIPELFSSIVLIALSSERSSFAVAVEPKVHVLHRWPKPPPERMEASFQAAAAMMAHEQEADIPQITDTNQVYLPCLSWGWALVSGGGHVISPILARAWGCCLQLLRAHFPETPPGDDLGGNIQWPAFGVHDEFDADAPVVALEWLNDRSLVYLTVHNEFNVIDTVMMTLLERLDFSGLKLVYAEFSLSRKVNQEDQQEQGPTAAAAAASSSNFCTTFQNSVRSCDDRLLLLCQDELKAVSIVGARRRISGLEQDGEWLEALALALDHYENTVKSQEDRRRQKDLTNHAHYGHGAKSEDEEWIAKLLVRYLNIAVDNAPDTNSMDLPPEFMQSQLELAQSHFQMLAGVCVEFCVTTKRLDLLFGPIFGRFASAGFLSTFLDVLEPYILNDKLDYIAPEAMAHFVEHCKATNGIATVERCLLHMDVTIMDFDSILGLLKVNEMYSALFYIFNQGLNDYTTPLEVLSERIFDAADTVSMSLERRPDGVPQNDFERYGYKALLYIQTCFRGKYFPQDTEMREDLVHSVRPQLLELLVQKQYVQRNSRRIKELIGQRAMMYPYAHVLLLVDHEALFDTMSIVMDAPDSEFGKLETDGMGDWDDEEDEAPSQGKRSPERQDIIRMFMSLLIPESDDSIAYQSDLHRSKPVVDSFLDFLADYLVKGVVVANQAVTFMILKRMAERYQNSRNSNEQQDSQSRILQLLTALPRSAYDAEEILELMQGAGIHRAALLMHQEGASYWEGSRDLEKRANHFRAAIDCYLGDAEVNFRNEVFAYVKKECSAAPDDDEGNSPTVEDQPITMRESLASKLTDLVNLDALLTAELVGELFVDDIDRVIATLNTEEARFKFLQAIISGELDKIDSVSGAVLNSHLTMDHHHLYLALMTRLHPESVYEYLSSHDNYRPEDCLKLCQKHEIADASAYLLERMGNVTSALQLILQTLESRMMNLKRTIRGMGTEAINLFNQRNSSRRWRKSETPMPTSYQKQEKEIDGVKRILVVALDVCERNSGNFSNRTEHGSQLWFNVLDRLINAKGFLRLSKEQPGHAKVMAGVLSELLRMTMQRMVSSVPLPDLVRKVTSDHSGSRLGELREMIESLLATYGLELKVFNRSVNIFKYDSRQMQKMNRDIRVKGSNVRKIMNVPMNKENRNNQTVETVAGEGNILQLVERGNAVVLDNDFRSRGQKTGPGLGNALSRLRSRRGAASQQKSAASRESVSTGLNYMTVSDVAHSKGAVDPDAMYFDDRMAGVLGDAEHRGRLMSFMY